MIQEGNLFKLTGADKIEFDFREEGSFILIFNGRGQIDGKFVKIIPDKLIELSWNVTGFGRTPEINSKVLISINEDEKSSITILHTDIQNHDGALAKQTAWTEILFELENIN